MAAEVGRLQNTKLNGGRVLFGDDTKRDLLLTILLTVAHLPLGLVLYNAGPFKIIHPILVIGVGVYLAYRKQSRYSDIALVLAYIVGVEVLWRMAEVPVLWEIGKYGPILIISIAVVRRSKWEIPKLSLIYFLLLIPACVLTVLDSTLSRSIIVLSFTISGPLFLFFSCWFFYKSRIGPVEFRRLLIAVIIPLLCVAFTSFFYTVSAERITFNDESNFATSGGFGPNQVSAMLGLGVFVAFAGFVLIKKGIGFTLYFGLIALFLAAICLLTFSRGGIYNAIAGIVVLLLFGLGDFVAGLRRLALTLVVVCIFIFLIFPVINDFTGGALQTRLENTGTTNRGDIAESDLQVFLENPLFGVGVGASKSYRAKLSEFGAASHTEFSRLVSEHGLFGIAALIALAGMALGNLRRPNSKPGKAFVAGAYAWAFFFMLNTGMRLAAPSFMWGLGFVAIISVPQMLPSLVRKRPIKKGLRIGGPRPQVASAKP